MATASKTPPINAELVRVYAVATAPDGAGDTTESQTVKWQGIAPAFTTERNAVELGGGMLASVYRATVVVPATLGSPPVTVEAGDRIEYVRNGEAQTRQVDATEDRADFGFVRCFVSEPD